MDSGARMLLLWHVELLVLARAWLLNLPGLRELVLDGRSSCLGGMTDELAVAVGG